MLNYQEIVKTEKNNAISAWQDKICLRALLHNGKA